MKNIFPPVIQMLQFVKYAGHGDAEYKYARDKSYPAARLI